MPRPRVRRSECLPPGAGPGEDGAFLSEFTRVEERRGPVQFYCLSGMFILSTGCQWRAVPKDLPPRSTLFDYLDLCSLDGTLDRMHHALYVACRKRDDREAGPTAAIIDS
jgi:hypothetical protein